MQLTIPDCCLGEFCPGIHVEGHHKRDDVRSHWQGSEIKLRVFHYRAPIIHPTTTRAILSIITIRAFSHSQLNGLVVLTVCTHHDCSDGSAFYRYPDGSEYYRRKNGNRTFRLPEEPNENAEGADPSAALTPATTDRTRRPWHDWPPQLNLSLKTDGNSVIIRDASGLTVTFEPAGTNAGVDLVPVHNGSASLFCNAVNVDLIPYLPLCRDTSPGEAHLDRSGPRASQGVAFGTQAWVKKQALADIVSRGGTGDGVVSV